MWCSWPEEKREPRPLGHLPLVPAQQTGQGPSSRSHQGCWPPPSCPLPGRCSPRSRWPRMPPAPCWLPLLGVWGGAQHQHPTGAPPLPPAPQVGAAPRLWAPHWLQWWQVLGALCQGPPNMKCPQGWQHLWEKSPHVPPRPPTLPLLCLQPQRERMQQRGRPRAPRWFPLRFLEVSGARGHGESWGLP